MSDKQKSMLIITALLLVPITLGLLFGADDGYHFPTPLVTMDEGTTDLSGQAIKVDESFHPGDELSAAATNYRDKEIIIDETFVSNLPLVVLDTNGVEPPRHTYFDEELRYAVTLENVEPFVEGTISLLDSGRGVNRLSDLPVLSSRVRLRRRGNSSEYFDKHQYLLKLLEEDGSPNRQDILGMGADDEWILNISFIDKSLLRNYLAYTAAGEIMPYVPDAQFCEVVWKDGDTYKYRGVYLMLESIKVGKRRVDLPAFSENAEYLPALMRRDRYNPEGVMLNNYARNNELLYGCLEVKWPNKSLLTKENLKRLTKQVDLFEKALFAPDYNEFLTYRNYIDIDSFVDYFIINEFFINYDAGNNSTYMYYDYSGKLTMGPIWDFDGAMDNYKDADADPTTTAFQYAPWFRQMLRDPEFGRLIMERYHELRASILSDRSIQTFIDDTVKGLGSAIDRDWARWGYFYQYGGFLKEEYPGQPDRNTKTHSQEVEKLKNVLSVHGNWLDENMNFVYQFTDPADKTPQQTQTQKEPGYGNLLALVYVAIFFVSIALVHRVSAA